jgi:hypothetical protein
LAKEEVYGDYLNSVEPNKTDPVIVPTYAPPPKGRGLPLCLALYSLVRHADRYFGKLVKKAFPSVRCNRKGPRGKAKQHYTHLQRVDHQREAERHRFNSFTEQTAPSAAAAPATATTGAATSSSASDTSRI